MKKWFYYSSFLLIIQNTLSAQTNTLDYFVQQGLANSPLLKDYQGQVQTNQLDSIRIRATYKPQVTGNSNNFYAPVIAGFGYDGAITNGGQVSALVGVNKTLVGKKNLGSQFENLNLQNQGINNAAKISEQDLVRTITAQYVSAYGSQQQLNFSRQVTELLKKEADVLKILTEKNVYRQTDYLTFLVTYQQQELAAKQLSIQFRNDYATLNYLSGTIDTTSIELQAPGLVIKQLPEQANSVFFRKYTIDSLQISNNRLLIDFSYKPKVNLFADGGYNSSFAYRGYKNFGTSFGVGVTVPIYDGRQKRIQYSKLDIAERTRSNYKDFYNRQYNQQVAQLTQQLKLTEELIGDITSQIKYAEGLINVNVKLLETGDARIPDLVIALNNYLSAKNLLTQNDISRLQIINQINYWNR